MTNNTSTKATLLIAMAHSAAKEIKDASKYESPERIAKLEKEKAIYRWAADFTAYEIHLRLIRKMDEISTAITNRVDGKTLAIDYAEMHALQKALRVAE